MSEAILTTADLMEAEGIATHFETTGDKLQLVNGGESVSSGSPGCEMSPLRSSSKETHNAQLNKKMNEGLKIIIVSAITFSIGVTIALILTIYLGPPQVEPHGAVSTDSEECSALGTDLLKKGGSAVDAALGSTLCMSLVHPNMCGIGGGGFIVVRKHKEKTTSVIDFRETAPDQSNSDMLDDLNRDNQRGKLVATPGYLPGLRKAHSQFGKLKWKDILQPVADLARNGFTITDYFAHSLTQLEDDTSNGAQEILDFFTNPVTNDIYRAGEIMVRTGYADILDGLAEDYEKTYAEIISEIVGTCKNNEGVIESTDFVNYKALNREPLVSTFLNMSVETMPLPGGGPVMLLLLNIMEKYFVDKNNSSDTHLLKHRLVESMKFAYTHLGMLGDPKNKNNLLNYTQHIISKEYAEELRKKIIDDSTQERSYYKPVLPMGVSSGTNQVSVIGEKEDFVSITTSINSNFGARLLAGNEILLNNHMEDFNSDQPNNGIVPGNRPMSGMTPTVIHAQARPCGLRVALGGTNGTRIISGVAQVIINLLGHHMNLKTAINAPRLHHDFQHDMLEYETDKDTQLIDYLKSMGHNMTRISIVGINAVNAAAKINETITAHSDQRKMGNSSVY